MRFHLKSRGLLFHVCNLLSKVLTPDYSSCGCCGGHWNVVQEHTTRCSDYEGCFPLCEHCWQKLETPEARLPYYKDLALMTWRDPSKWAALRTAVLQGK